MAGKVSVRFDCLCYYRMIWRVYCFSGEHTISEPAVRVQVYPDGLCCALTRHSPNTDTVA